MRRATTLLAAMALTAAARGDGGLGEHGFADSGGVKIHYVTRGEGPLVVMVHGFPDYWYTWRNQMPALAKKFQVVAIDQRGYNKSDKPDGVAAYAMPKLVGDVKAVVGHFKRKKAIIVGHDWGGAVAWSFAMAHPAMTDRLIILNTPHPYNMQRELATNPEQKKNSAYARVFQKPGVPPLLTAESLAAWVKDAADRKKYAAALKRSSLAGMLNYYKANYPREPYTVPKQAPPKVKCPVLLIHGLGDKYLLAGGLNGTWDRVEKTLTLVTVPGAGHFVQHDAADLVTRRMLRWLAE